MTPGATATHGSLLADLPLTPEAAERFETLLSRPGLRIERIVSTGQASPPGFWYEQTQGEWVLLVSGEARLRFEDDEESRLLRDGDWLYIAPGRRHRVEWTAADRPSVWLALHFPDDLKS